MTYRYFPDRTLVMVWLEMVNWKQRIENSGRKKTGDGSAAPPGRRHRTGSCLFFAVSYSLFLLSLFLFYFVFFRLFL